MAASGGSGGDDDDATTILSTTPTIVIDDQPDMSDDYNEHDDDDEIPRRLSQQLTIRKKSSYRLGDFLYSYWLRTRTGTDQYSYGLLLLRSATHMFRIHVLVLFVLVPFSSRMDQYSYAYGVLRVRLRIHELYYSYGTKLV